MSLGLVTKSLRCILSCSFGYEIDDTTHGPQTEDRNVMPLEVKGNGARMMCEAQATHTCFLHVFFAIVLSLALFVLAVPPLCRKSLSIKMENALFRLSNK